jgi:hypothetical protein
MQRIRQATARSRTATHCGATALLAILLLTAAAPAVAQEEDATTMQRGRELTQLFYDGDMDSIVAVFDERMSAALGGVPELSAFRDQVVTQLGSEVDVLDERVATSGEHRVYHRSARFEKVSVTVAVVWSFDGSGRIAGFMIRPEASQQSAIDVRGLPQRVNRSSFSADRILPVCET